MKMSILIGLVTMAALAGASTPARAEGAVAGRWRGLLLRDGRQIPIAVDLADAHGEWSGRLGTNATSLPLESVRVQATTIHFEVAGQGSFDGMAAGNSMAGSISGASTSASFALSRETEPLFDPIGSFGP
jgi:hypothetical protein